MKNKQSIIVFILLVIFTYYLYSYWYSIVVFIENFIFKDSDKGILVRQKIKKFLFTCHLILIFFLTVKYTINKIHISIRLFYYVLFSISLLFFLFIISINTGVAW
jgi:hypothetical protein